MFEDRTPETIKREVLEAVAADGRAEVSTIEGSYTDVLVGPLALEQSKVYQALSAVLAIAFPDEGSGGYIDLEGGKYGIYRKAGTRARADMTLSGRAGVIVPAGTVFCTQDGLEFALLEDILLSGGTDACTVEAVEAGSAYNVGAGELSQLLQTIPGLESWDNAAADGGTDEESDAALFSRIDAYRKRPATSGNPAHYEQWASEVDGVGAAKTLPTWDGPGTVKVLLVDSTLGPVAEHIVANAAAHIEEERPIGPVVTVESAQAVQIDVAATVTLDSSVTLPQVTTAFSAALEAFLKSLLLTAWRDRRGKTVTIPFNRVAYLLLAVPGVLDYSALTLCSGNENITLTETQIPSLGEVRIE